MRKVIKKIFHNFFMLKVFHVFLSFINEFIWFYLSTLKDFFEIHIFILLCLISLFFTQCYKIHVLGVLICLLLFACFWLGRDTHTTDLCYWQTRICVNFYRFFVQTCLGLKFRLTLSLIAMTRVISFQSLVFWNPYQIFF